MPTAEPSTRLLEVLPRALRGEIALRVVRGTGEVVQLAGAQDETRIRIESGALQVQAGAGREALTAHLRNGDTIVATFDPRAPGVAEVLRELLEMLVAKDLVEADMESIHSSSLVLLEEVSMIADTLPRLPTCKSGVEVAEMGLEALVLAASLQRALYVQLQEAAGYAEVLVQVGLDQAGRRVVPIPYEGRGVLAPGEGLVWDALRGDGSAVLRVVPAGGQLGRPGSPEWLAEREVVAVPVCYGSDAQRVTLGALVIMDKRANVYSSSRHLGSEETKLATAVASMLGSVLGTRRVAEFDKELGLANELQRQILPDRPAQVAGFELAGRCCNSGAVGGDYFDFIPMRDGRTMAVVADVSGHNLASGMLMGSVRSTLRMLAGGEHGKAGLAALFDELARAQYPDLIRTERFITAVAAALRPRVAAVEMVGAGHNDAMLYRAATGVVERVASGAPVLGFLSAPTHQQVTVDLAPNDVLLLYTDGVVEVTCSDGEMLGEERLERILAGAAPHSAQRVLDAVFAAVEELSDKSVRGDDVTAVVVKWLGSAADD